MRKEKSLKEKVKPSSSLGTNKVTSSYDFTPDVLKVLGYFIVETLTKHELVSSKKRKRKVYSQYITSDLVNLKNFEKGINPLMIFL